MIHRLHRKQDLSMNLLRIFALTAFALPLLGGCDSGDAPASKVAAAPKTTREIQPGPNVQDEVQEALIKAKPGDSHTACRRELRIQQRTLPDGSQGHDSRRRHRQNHPVFQKTGHGQAWPARDRGGLHGAGLDRGRHQGRWPEGERCRECRVSPRPCPLVGGGQGIERGVWHLPRAVHQCA